MAWRNNRALVSGGRIALAATLFLVLSNPASAEDSDWKKGKLERLSPTIGTYHYQQVLEDPDVQVTLKDRLSPDALAALKVNLQVAAPIDFIDGYLVLSGNRPHYGGEDSAMVWVKIYDGTVDIVLQQGGKTTLYSKAQRYEYLPGDLRARLAAPPAKMPWQALPPDVIWVR